MLERYFVRPDTIDRIRGSWIGEAIERYVEWLTNQRYAPRNMVRRVPILVRFGQYAWDHDARSVEQLPEQVDAFVNLWLRERERNAKTPLALGKIENEVRTPIQQMLRLAVPGYEGKGRCPYGDPFSDQAADFFRYLREERGLRERSVRHYQHYLRGFEKYLKKAGLCTLAELSPVLLSAYVTDSIGKLSKSSVISLCATLRVFLRYLHRQGVLSRNLSSSVGTPKKYRNSDIPRSISWTEVQTLLETIERRAPCGRRDYAILLLLVTYGLRAREIAKLTLHGIDWNRNRLLVSERKAGHTTAYPLSPVVGEAIVDYLKHGRPETPDRHLFLRVLAPYEPLRQSAVSLRVSHYLHKAGIKVPRAGSHTLRHTCVQRLVDARFSLKDIGDYVGHRSASSTNIYTKVSVDKLREVALGAGEDVL